MKLTKTKKAFGDFQTPKSLVVEMCDLLDELKINPKVIIEPTCGKGNILLTALDRFKTASKGIGIEINIDYINQLKQSSYYKTFSKKIDLFHSDFFTFDFTQIDYIKNTPTGDLLIIGNPPWVTNSELGLLNSKNLPKKSNFSHQKGIAAITGKSNFDISEYMILEFLKKYSKVKYSLAILCKTSVARKILFFAWKNAFKINNEKIFHIDAKKYFSASVDACMLFFQNGNKGKNQTCELYDDMNFLSKKNTIGYSNSHLISNIELYEKSKHIEGKSPYVWRNGLKHDASKIMELLYVNHHLTNGLGEKVEIEKNLLFPFLKSSDIAYNQILKPRKYVLVTQRFIGEETNYIQHQYPKTWKYLEKHQEYFINRKSSIYKNKPKFSIFSVGEYTYAPYKIAISSFYKKLFFKLISSYESKPCVLDDTCNFIPAYSIEEATLLLKLLNSKVAVDFLNSNIFWDAKRVITTEILNRLDINKVAEELNSHLTLNKYKIENKFVEKDKHAQCSFL